MIDILVPCYKRADYTKLCLEALEKNTKHKDVMFYLMDDGSRDTTVNLFQKFKLPCRIISHSVNHGLRDIIINFFSISKGDYVAKIDNDVLVPVGWLDNLKEIYDRTDVDVLSPNVRPSDAASRMGEEVGGYLKSRTIGGLWFMRRDIIKDTFFEKLEYGGIKCAHAIVHQIQTENDLNVGWTKEVTVDDIGHWSGKHEKHVKSPEHLRYSMEIGREVSWTT